MFARKWNKFIFRTGRNSSQDAISNAVALDAEGVSIATLAQDYAFGRDGVKAFKDSIKKATIVHEEYLPTNTTDFTVGAQRLFDALKDKPGRKVIWIVWAGAGNPFKIADLDPQRHGIEIATGGNILPAMAAYKRLLALEPGQVEAALEAERRCLVASIGRQSGGPQPRQFVETLSTGADERVADEFERAAAATRDA